MKLTFSVAAWVILSSTHTMGAIAIIDPSYVAYMLGFVGIADLWQGFESQVRIMPLQYPN
jgi:hypothetical protein